MLKTTRSMNSSQLPLNKGVHMDLVSLLIIVLIVAVVLRVIL